MSMMNNINFTGIRNIATIQYRAHEYNRHYPAENLSMILNDDFNGKTLEEFKQVLKKAGKSDFLVKDFSDLLNIGKITVSKNKDKLFINGNFLKCNDKNLPIFTFIAKITKAISKMPKAEMIVNQDYKNSFVNETLIPGQKLSELIDTSGENFFDSFFDKNNVKSSAKRINLTIDKIMSRYFNV